MSLIDVGIVIFILFGIYAGYREGFLLELFSLLGILLGVLGGFKLMGWAMVFLSDKFNVDKKVLPYIAFAAVFIGIVIAVSLLGKMLKLSVGKSFLGKIDQVAGALLGTVKTIFMLSVTIWILEALKVDLDKWSSNSALYSFVADFAPKTTAWIGEIIPFFRDVL
jgi:membrane protein required for colicin V production